MEISLWLEHKLGFGSDGIVWRSTRPSAVKVLENERNYRNEITCYQRLNEAGVYEIAGLAVPLLIDHDDNLMVVEMEIVQPPFLLDFGKVYLDNPPEYLSDVQSMANSYRDWQEWFGDRWDEIPYILALLQKHGIYYPIFPK